LANRPVAAHHKQLVIQRARGCCEYCQSQSRFTNQAFSIEHIIPKSQGGQNALDNLALSCQSCNNHKYTKITGIDPITGETASLYHPRQESWAAHFAWNEDCTLIIGLTPIGRATVETLHLNKPGLVNLRQILYAIGEHPPR
jgi:hypothetical protein